MRAHQIMTKDVMAVTPHTTIEDAARIMVRTHVSGLPVLDDAGMLVGVVSESDSFAAPRSAPAASGLPGYSSSRDQDGPRRSSSMSVVARSRT
jgi:CBS domain-containing protein